MVCMTYLVYLLYKKNILVIYLNFFLVLKLCFFVKSPKIMKKLIFLILIRHTRTWMTRKHLINFLN